MAADQLSTEMMQLQVMRLLSGMCAHGDRHLTEVGTDLAQVSALLDEAIKKLGASFMAIHSALGKQQEALNVVFSGRVSLEDGMPGIEAIQGEIGRHINAAVTGLQFQDLTSQLIGRMAKHLSELREVFAALDADGTGMQPEVGHGKILAHLCIANHKLEELNVGSNGCTQKSVSQMHMESGDIELFTNHG